jgi:outer membrane receptor for ferrienterochelin and colicins
MVSYTNHVGPVEYTLSADDTRSSNRGAFGGPDDIIYDPDGNVVERRVQRLYSDFTQPWFKVATKIDVTHDSIANLSVQYGPYWYDFGDHQKRHRSDPSDDRIRDVSQSQQGYMTDVNADYEFPLGPGRLKLIGLKHYEHEPTRTVQRTAFSSGAADEGVRFFRDAHLGEFILRGEYGWKGGANDWQVTLERAVNTLSQKGELSLLDGNGEWQPQDFPQGTGDVAEHRYEATATLSRALSPNVDFQLVAGGEISKLERLDPGHEKVRNFFRPKGSLSLSWRPAKGWDASAKLSRRVGQISFYDFLAQLDLNVDRENVGNPDLVPPQSWEFETEVAHEFAPWGKGRIKLFYNRIDDIIDIVPIGEDGQSIGNLPRAKQWGGEFTSTINLDSIGWHGAKLDLSAAITRSRVKDPLSGQSRPISGDADYSWEIDLRHDIPHSDLAWGANLNGNKNFKNYYLDEISQEWEGPVWGNVFIEHKNVFGMTVQASVRNLLDGRHFWNRDVYAGFRDRTPLIFRERQKQLIGPIFYLSIKGSF